MNLVDMKRPKKSTKEMQRLPTVTDSNEQYPYGLRLTLEKEELGKLGLKVGDFDIGIVCSIQCEGEIVSLRESVGRAGEESGTVEIQIVKMTVSGGKKGKFQEYKETKQAGPGKG